jgi:hypothetical protein
MKLESKFSISPFDFVLSCRGRNPQNLIRRLSEARFQRCNTTSPLLLVIRETWIGRLCSEKKNSGFTYRAESANGYRRFGLVLQREEREVRKRSETEVRETGEGVVLCERQSQPTHVRQVNLL